ncbi:MAG: cytidylate kinase family protein [Desulfomonile sp.]|nr:cytidylate kinase family protein [Desulfomonile sp.]
MQIVTISTQVGSYGEVIAALVARTLGLELISREKVHELAQTCDADYRDACSLYETEHGPGFLRRIFFDKPSHTSLFESLAYEQAARGNVVIVGRGAQIVLRDVPGVLKVRVVAPSELRIQRVMERYGMSCPDAADYVRRHDHERRNLMRSVFDVDATDWALYDLILNTARFDSGSGARIVVSAVENLPKPADEEALKRKLTAMAFAKRVETVIRKKLTSTVAHNVTVTATSDGVLTLSGRVRDHRDREWAEQIAREYPGVTSVTSELKVTELSFGI